MNIGVDVFPVNLIPFSSFDYATKSLVGLFYIPIVSKQENQSLARVYKHNKLEWSIVLKKDIKWSNGKEVEPRDIIDTWKYIFYHCPLFSKEFDWIKNWKDARNEKCSFNKIGLSIKKNIINITLQYPVDVEMLLSNIGYTPVYLDCKKKILPIGTGPFVPLETDLFCYNNNEMYPLFFSKKLQLILTNSPIDAVEKYENSVIEVTPTTLFNPILLDTLVGTQIYRKSNIHAGIVLVSNRAKKMKITLQNLLHEFEFNEFNINKADNYFFLMDNKLKQYPKKSIGDESKYQKKNITIGVVDFYPNFEIISSIFKDYNINIIAIELENINKSIEKNKEIDLFYNLFTTTVLNDFSLLMSYIPFFEEEIIDDYLKLLNNFDIYALNILEKIEINNFLKAHSQYIPIGNLYHRYNCKYENRQLEVDENDTYFLRSI
ncbi:hypothetical protein ACWOFR_04800 [Carnobacterium gallinarum]|uniref:hypothetical protein n=1 Tax=Carnobacterium gallinarum TaxID=2749 RepID=UPI00055396BE|nr:hypothetical protein [Carnobacterium gallinarum]